MRTFCIGAAAIQLCFLLILPISGCRKVSPTSDVSNPHQVSLIVSIPKDRKRDGIDTVVAIPESSVKGALQKTIGKVRTANRGDKLEMMREQLADVTEEAAGKLKGWIEDATGVLPRSRVSLLEDEGTAFLKRLNAQGSLAGTQSRKLTELVSEYKTARERFRQYERSNGKLGFRAATVDPMPEEMATATWWMLDKLGRAVIGVHRGNQTDELFSSLITGKPVSNHQVLFELDPKESHFIIANSMSGEIYFDHVTASQSEPLNLEPGTSPRFNIMRDRIIASAMASNMPTVDSVDCELEKAAAQQIETCQVSISTAQRFIRSGEAFANNINKAISLGDELKSKEADIAITRNDIASLQNSIRKLEAEKNSIKQ